MLELLEERNAPGSVSGAMTGTDPVLPDAASQTSLVAPTVSGSGGSAETLTDSAAVATNSAPTDLSTTSASTAAQAPLADSSADNSAAGTSAADAVFTSPITSDLFASPMTDDSSAASPPSSPTAPAAGGGTVGAPVSSVSLPAPTPAPTAAPDTTPATTPQTQTLGVSLTLQPPVQTASGAQQVSLVVTNPNGAVPDGTAATLLVDVNQDGTFAGSVSGVVQGKTAVFTLPTLPPGSYAMKAQLTDATGAAWTSNVQTLTVQPPSDASTAPQTPAPTDPAAGPGLILLPPTQTTDGTQQVSLMVAEPNGVVPDGTAATLLVDVNQDGSYALSVAGVVSGGVAVFTLPTLTPGFSYDMEAQLTDTTGLVSTSNIQTITVPSQAHASTDNTAEPGLIIQAPTQTADGTTQVSVVVNDPNGVVPDGTAATLLVDVNQDGSYALTVAGVVSGGVAVFTLPTLPSGTSYTMEAQLTDATGVVWTGNVQTLTVQPQLDASTDAATGPGLVLQAPTQSADGTTQVSVVVNGPNGAVPDGTAATLFVDVNGDGTYALSVAGIVSGGMAVFTLPTLPTGSNYNMEAQLTDAAGVVWTSNVQTTMVQPQSGAATSGSDSGAVLVAGGGLGTGSNSGGGTSSGPGSGTSSGDGSGSGSGSNAGSGSILESGALAMAPAPIVGNTDVQQEINELQQQVTFITGAIIHAQQMAAYEYSMYEYFNTLANQERGFIRAIVDNPNDSNSSAQNLEHAYADLFIFDQMQVTCLQSTKDWISYQSALRLIRAQINLRIVSLQSP